MTLLDANTARAIKELIDQQDETPEERYYLEEYFKKRPAANSVAIIDPDANDATALAAFVVANKDFELQGTSADDAKVTFDATNAALLLTCDGASADQMIITPHLDTNQTAWAGIKWGTENQVEWECSIKTGASLATCMIWAGLKLTSTGTIATDDDQVFFRYNTTDDTTAYWRVISSIDDTDTATTTPVAITVNTIYNLKIKIDYARIARFYINDVLVYTTTALTNDINLIPYVAIQALDTTASTLLLHYMKISRVLYE